MIADGTLRDEAVATRPVASCARGPLTRNAFRLRRSARSFGEVSASTPAERNYGRILPAVAAVALIGTVVMIAGGLERGGDGDQAPGLGADAVAAVPPSPPTTAWRPPRRPRSRRSPSRSARG